MKFLLFIFLVIIPRAIYAPPQCASCRSLIYTPFNVTCACPPKYGKLNFTSTFPGFNNQVGQCCDLIVSNPICSPSLTCPLGKALLGQPISMPGPCHCVCDNYGILDCFTPSSYNENTCKCVCPPGTNTICPSNHFFDDSTCTCACNVTKVCPPYQYFDKTTCECVCNPINAPVKCLPPRFYNKNTCSCECPDYAYMTCAFYQYFDAETCSCPCREQCQECSSNQVWNKKSCSCECPPQQKPCASNKFWNEWSCQCECQQAPRDCCPELNKMWNPNVRLH